MKRFTILVCTHKEAKIISNEVYMPIHTGKANGTAELGIEGDNTGENISTRNPNFSEMTAHYWAWKNLKELDYIGLCHYRRYFDFKRERSVRAIRTISESEVNDTNIIVPQIKELSKDCDIILPQAIYISESIASQYMSCHIPEDYLLMERAILELYPEYADSIKKVFHNNNKMLLYNMFICRWQIFDDYSNWLFPIFDLLDKNIKFSDYPYQKRVYAFMSERLLQLYCYHNKLKIKTFPILYINDDSKDPKLLSLFWTIFKRNIKFILSGISRSSRYKITKDNLDTLLSFKYIKFKDGKSQDL